MLDRTRRNPHHGRTREEAFTGLDIVSGGAVLIIALALIIHVALGIAAPRNPQGGIIPRAIQQTGDQLNVFGSIAGFPAASGPLSGIYIRRTNPDCGRLGGVGMTLSLFIGSTGGIDLARTTVLWADSSRKAAVPFTKEKTVLCPNWTIVNKYNINPFGTADGDDILEPGEQFDIFICPAGTYAPYEEFTIEYEPPGSGPHFPVKCTVPFPIKQTMEL